MIRNSVGAETRGLISKGRVNTAHKEDLKSLKNQAQRRESQSLGGAIRMLERDTQCPWSKRSRGDSRDLKVAAP